VCSDLEIFTCGLGLVLGLGVWPRLTSLALTVGTLTRAKLRQIITIITTMTDDDYFFLSHFTALFLSPDSVKAVMAKAADSHTMILPICLHLRSRHYLQ